jgi:hypothetical protein
MKKRILATVLLLYLLFLMPACGLSLEQQIANVKEHSFRGEVVNVAFNAHHHCLCLFAVNQARDTCQIRVLHLATKPKSTSPFARTFEQEPRFPTLDWIRTRCSESNQVPIRIASQKKLHRGTKRTPFDFAVHSHFIFFEDEKIPLIDE